MRISIPSTNDSNNQKHNSKDNPQKPSKIASLSFNQNINKLIFYASDEDCSEEESNHQTLCRTTREISQTKVEKTHRRGPFRAESLMIKPSLMQRNDEEEEYRNIPIISKQIIPPLQPNKEVKCSQTEQSKQQFLQLKVLPNTLYFMESEEEDNSEEKEDAITPSKQPHNETKKEMQENDLILSRPPNKSSNIFEQPQDEYQEESESSGSDKQTEQGRSINLLHISQKIKRKSYYFNDILRYDSDDRISSLMFTPLLKGTAQIFEVHVYSNFLQKTFQLWIDELPTMRLLMKATKLVTPRRTTYELMTVIEPSNIYACKLVSNFERSEFNIQKQIQQNGEISIIGTISCSTTLQNDKNLVLYYPLCGPRRNQPPCIIKDEQFPSLKEVFKEQKDHYVGYLMTTHLKEEERMTLAEQHHFRTSCKSMEFKNKAGELKMIIGKKGSKRYSIIVGHPLTPVQVFSLSIVNIETS